MLPDLANIAILTILELNLNGSEYQFSRKYQQKTKIYIRLTEMCEQANYLVKELKITNIRRKYSGISEKIRVSFNGKEFTSRCKRVALKSLPNLI